MPKFAANLSMLSRTALRLGSKAPAPSKLTGLAPKVDPSTTGDFAPNDGNETMMPWNGWFSDALKKGLGDEKYEKLRRTVLFKPDDIHNFEGVPQSARLTMPGVERIKGPRYPAPGSRPIPTIPKDPEGTDPYDINYYSRDTRRNGNTRIHYTIVKSKDVAALLEQNPSAKIEGSTDDELVMASALEPLKGIGSPGNGGMFATGKSDFDPTGLRAAMQTSHAQMEARLAEHQPTQLPTYEWEGRQEELLADWKAKGLPVQPGQGAAWAMPKGARVASW